MNTKRQWLSIACAFACVFALVLSLTGCGGVDTEAAKKNFVGSWELYSADFEGEDSDMTHDDYVAFSTLFGMSITMDFDDQGNFVLDTLGEIDEGTWEVVDATTIKVTINNSPQEMKLVDNMLVMEKDDESMTFERKSETPNMNHEPGEGGVLGDSSDSGSSNSTSTTVTGSQETDDAAADAYVADVENIAAKNVEVCNDDVITIKVTGVGKDYEGDTGYLMTVTNNTDQDIYLVNDGGTVDGVDCEPTLYMHIKPGDTRDTFMFFDQNEAVITESTKCTSAFGVFGADQDTLLGIYEFEV